MGFSEIDVVLQIFSTFEAQGTNGLFQVRDRDGAMTKIGRNADQPVSAPFYATRPISSASADDLRGERAPPPA
jgi:hypothetical protein